VFTVTQPKFGSEALSTESLVEALAGRIREERDRANLTQKELARRLRVSERSVQDWEAGRTFPSARMRRRIDRFFERQAERAAA
jgi:ribosome-binding protein aMBF1 (putative translation factor)